MTDETEKQLLEMFAKQQAREAYVENNIRRPMNQARIIEEDKALEASGNERYKQMAEKAEKTAGGTKVKGKLSFLHKCKSFVQEFAQGALERWSAKHEKIAPTPRVSRAARANIDYFHTR